MNQLTCSDLVREGGGGLQFPYNLEYGEAGREALVGRRLRRLCRSGREQYAREPRGFLRMSGSFTMFLFLVKPELLFFCLGFVRGQL